VADNETNLSAFSFTQWVKAEFNGNPYV